VIGRQTATGNDAVQVRMEMKILSPGVQHTEETERHAETPRIGGNAEQGLRGDAEKDLIDHLFVIEGDVGDGLGQGEDHVEILGGQQLGLPLFEPLGARQSLTLGTVPVAAGAVAGMRVMAVVAPFRHTAQRRGPAGLNGLHQAMLMQR
jgi:hypothetical protein